MSSTSVLFATETATTDAQARFSSSYTTYRDAMFTFTNPSTNQGIFRVVTGSSTYTEIVERSLETTVEGNATATIVAVGLHQREVQLLPAEEGVRLVGETRRQEYPHHQETRRCQRVHLVQSGGTHLGKDCGDFTYSVHVRDKADPGTEVDRITVVADRTQKYTAVFNGLST